MFTYIYIYLALFKPFLYYFYLTCFTNLMIMRYCVFLSFPCFIFGFVVLSYVFTVFSTHTLIVCFQHFRNL